MIEKLFQGKRKYITITFISIISVGVLALGVFLWINKVKEDKINEFINKEKSAGKMLTDIKYDKESNSLYGEYKSDGKLSDIKESEDSIYTLVKFTVEEAENDLYEDYSKEVNSLTSDINNSKIKFDHTYYNVLDKDDKKIFSFKDGKLDFSALKYITSH